MEDRDRERIKYEKMWDRPEYRRHSPAERIMQKTIQYLDLKEGDVLLDLGCGSGRAAQLLSNMGVAVTAIDHAVNCLDEGIEVPFVQACLWDLPEDLTSPKGICIDVMEHIPENRIPEMLEGFRDRVDTMLFQISTVEDGCGRLINECLHVTVRPTSWWINIIEALYGDVEVLDQSAIAFTCIAKANR